MARGRSSFAHCNLRCVFCQNFDISQDIKSELRRLNMPVYEFACRDCQKTFESVRPMSESSSANVTCPHCGSARVERIWSSVHAITSKKS